MSREKISPLQRQDVSRTEEMKERTARKSENDSKDAQINARACLLRDTK